jgi:ketosteroid isomerase-like protein
MNIQTQETFSINKVKIVQQVYAAFQERDFDVILALLSNDVEWGEPANPFNPAGGIRHGHSGFLDWLRIGRDSEEILVLNPKKFLTDNDSVAVIGYTKCLAKLTNKIYETDFVHLITFKDGKIILFQEFFDTYIAGEAFRN